MNEQSLPVKPAIPVVGITGKPGSGKTELIRALVTEWSKRGQKVAVIERNDAPDEASPRIREVMEAGAFAHVISGPGQVAFHFKDNKEIQPEIVAATYLAGVDLALVESRESLNLPCIDIYRKNLQKTLTTRKRKNLLAVTGDRPPDDKDWPYVEPGDLTRLVDLIEEKIISKTEEKQNFDLIVDGRRVPVLPFVRDIISNTVRGLVTSLKSCKNADDIRLNIRRD